MKLEKSLSETGLNSAEGFRDFPLVGPTCVCLPGEPNDFLEGAFLAKNLSGSLCRQWDLTDGQYTKGKQVI